MPKTEFRRERRIWWSIVSKAAERSNKRRTEMLSLSRAARISFTMHNKTVSVLFVPPTTAVTDYAIVLPPPTTAITDYVIGLLPQTTAITAYVISLALVLK